MKNYQFKKYQNNNFYNYVHNKLSLNKQRLNPIYKIKLSLPKHLARFSIMKRV